MTESTFVLLDPDTREVIYADEEYETFEKAMVAARQYVQGWHTKVDIGRYKTASARQARRVASVTWPLSA